jgi:hypothetical protein
MPPTTNQRTVANILMFSGVLAIFIMMHHPTHFDQSTLNAWVHGGMIGTILLSTFGVTYYSLQCNIQRPLVLAGCLLYIFGSIFNILAATINGFVMPELIAKFGTESTAELRSLGWFTNQNLARLAVVLHGVVMLLFSLDLVITRPSKSAAALAVLGLLCGIFSTGILIVHRGHLDVHTAIYIYGIESIWLVLCGFQLRQLNPPN